MDTHGKLEQLTNFNFWQLKHSVLMAKWLQALISQEEAGSHGESPELGEPLAEVHSEYLSNPDRLIKILPHILNAHNQAMIEILVENNRLLLERMSDLIGREHAK